MRVYLQPPFGLSRAMLRVSDALTRYAPPYVKVVDQEVNADVVLLHCVCYKSTMEMLERINFRGQAYAMMQYCIRSTERPLTRAWFPFWQKALLVWSYYDLKTLAQEDHPTGFDWEGQNFNFLYQPLGADAEVFKPTGNDHGRYTIATSGYVAHSEGVAECAVATERVAGLQFHLGPEMYLGPHVKCLLNINDERLAYEYTRSGFVAGLRRDEGFELPAAEGLLCGARPIMFDAPHYRAWFNEFAEFVPEGSFDEVTDAIEVLFRAGPRRVSDAERQLAVERFSWERLANEFWKKI